MSRSLRTPARQQRGSLRFSALWLTPVIALVLYLLLWPTGVEPVSWLTLADRGYSGAHAPNQRLTGLTLRSLGGGRTGPEHMVAFQGAIYMGLSNGDIVRFGPEGRPVTVLNTGGRPLGLEISPTGRMYIADAMKGLLTADLLTPQPQTKLLLDKTDWPQPDDPLRYADAVSLDSRGDVWLTDASRRFGAKEHGGTFEASVLDILEHSCTGRVLVVDPRTQHSRVALSGLCFPNGLVFSKDGKSLLLSETGAFRIIKMDLARLSLVKSSQGIGGVASLQDAMDQGAATVLIDNLPGYPDNLTRGENGRLWVGLTKPRGKLIDLSADQPWLRSVMLRLPRAAWPVPKAYGHVIAFDEAGQIIDDLQDPSGAYPETTAAVEMGGRLYVQSLNAKSVGSMLYTGPPRGVP